MTTFKRNHTDQTNTNTYRAPFGAALGLLVAAAATVGLVSQVARSEVVSADPAVVAPSDGSFDRAEYSRHLSILKSSSDGFIVAEDARFGRLNSADHRPSPVNGFDRAERARHEGLAP